MMTDSAMSHEMVEPSWKREFIQGYGCGLEGGVEPYTVLQPVLAPIIMTDMPLARRPSTAWRSLVIEGVGLAEHGHEAFHDELFVGDGAILGLVLSDAFGGILVILATEPDDDMGEGLAEQLVYSASGLRDLRAGEFVNALVFETRSALVRRRSAFLHGRAGRM
jgi:hypothetical protein